MVYDTSMTILRLRSVIETATVLKVRPARVRELIRSGKLVGNQSATSFRWTVSSGSLSDYLGRPRLKGRPLKALQQKKKKRGRK